MLCVAKVLSGPCLSWVKLRRTQCGHMFSALLSNSDIAQCGWHVSNVPLPDSSVQHMMRAIGRLLDYLVGALLEEPRHVDTERLGSLEVDH